MSARILVVDDVQANVKILEAKLTALYYTVLKAYDGAEALRVAAAEQPDLILLDVMMPEMDGFECCRRLKADPALAPIPVVMVTALDGLSDRVRGLEAGADDFLTKPPNDLALFARVRSLVRLKMMIDELRLRDDTFRELGVTHRVDQDVRPSPDNRILVIDSMPERALEACAAITQRLGVEAIFVAGDEFDLSTMESSAPDMLYVTHDGPDFDGVRLASQLRSHPVTRQSAILVAIEEGDYEAVAAALDVGASDYIMRPIDQNELLARCRSQLLRKQYADRLRSEMHASARAAAVDGLTGVYNRRYVQQHLARLIDREGPARVAAIMIDIDRFKSINDGYGHAAGDTVLRDVASRMRDALRGTDMLARYGGEEFLVVLPETSRDEAIWAAERLRETVADAIFEIEGACFNVTASFGVAMSLGPEEDAEALIARADAALYRSKRAGRNRVTGAGPDSKVA